MFLGCGISEDGDCFLVTEFMDGGSLDRALWGSTTATSWMQRIQILLDVADGLGYLHLYHKSVHQDLKSPNILLEKIVRNDDAARSDDTVTHRAKIADFGLSKIFTKGKMRIGTTQETKKSSKKAIKSANWISMKREGFVGTPRWMAPEMMQTHTKLGPSADIYSFGVVMWEVWSQRKPWSELSNKQDIFEAVRDEKRILPSLDKDDENVPDGYGDLMKRCFKYKANQRPLIDVVRDRLQDLLERAAEIDREQLTSSRSSMPLETTGKEVETKSPGISNNSMKETRSETDQTRNPLHSTDSSLQGNNSAATTTAVHIEMGTVSSSTNGGKEVVVSSVESKYDDDISGGGAIDLSSSGLE